MSKTYITSDLHFGHKNILKFCPETRGKYYGDIDYMRESMIEEWNNIVNEEDVVYILGDVCFGSAIKSAVIVNRLNGRLILVKGNHDHEIIRHNKEFRDAFDSIHDYLTIVYDGTFVVMFHYPIATFDKQHRGAVHFHGHLHGAVSGLEHYRVRDMGYDATGHLLVEMGAAIEEAMKGEIKPHH